MKKILFLSGSQVVLYGTELITNGDFSTDSDWTYNAETSYNVARETSYINGANNWSQAIKQNISSTNGLTYRTSFEIKNWVSGQVQLKLGNATGTLSYVGANGVYTQDIVSDFADIVIQMKDSAVDMDIDNISVKEVL